VNTNSASRSIHYEPRRRYPRHYTQIDTVIGAYELWAVLQHVQGAAEITPLLEASLLGLWRGYSDGSGLIG